ncbi:MAG: calcium/sodium antiporter [Candidatus Gracilibacteria bacterium]|nr:calcium/sodium antiporter [Candidatus Gracilibacteria bacterium]
MEYLLIIIGFILLIFGANFLVDGACSVAKKFGISNLIIGLTVVAFGTSAPELAVNLISAIGGNTDLSISNVLGSNISNTLLILGATALFGSMKMPKKLAKIDLPFYLFIVILFGLLLNDKLLGFGNQNLFSRLDSVIFGIIFVLFLIYTFKKSSKNNEEVSENGGQEIKEFGTFKSVVFILGGLFGLVYGGDLIVNNAVSIANSFGIPKNIVGVTIVAIGTSLPELAASVTAALRKNVDMAVGTVIGSNIFNTLWILGATGIIKPLQGYQGVNIDISVTLISIIMLFAFVFITSRDYISRIEGVFLLLAYGSYLTYLVVNI